MMKKTSGIAAVLLLTAAILLLSTVTYAIYTNLSGKKGVVVVGGEEICYYSSDKLNNYPDSSDLQNTLDNQMYVNFENGDRTVSFKVKNTSRKGNGTANQYDIGYKIVLKVRNHGGEDITSVAQVTVSKGGTPLTFGENGVSTEEFYLGGGAIASHLFTVQFPEGCEDQMAVAIEARPLAESKRATKNTTLYREFVPTSTSSDNYIFSCVGKFSDNTEDEGNTPAQYHAFNYLITVSNGSGTVTLTWNGDYLKLDRASYAKLGVTAEDTTTNGAMRSLTFNADASDMEQDYDIVFYKEENFPSLSPTWDEMETNYVNVAGQESVTP